MKTSVIGSTGARVTGGPGTSLGLTVGQCMAGALSGPVYDVGAGFWTGASAPTTDAGDATIEAAPASTRLHSAYPNPIRPDTQVRFDIAGAPGTRVPTSVKVFSLDGRLVRNLMETDLAPGRYSARWNGTDMAGGRVASGIYYCQLVSQSHRETIRLVLLK